MTDDLGTLRDHVDRTWTSLGGLREQVQTLADVQKAQGEKLDKIATALTRYEGRPAFDPARIISLIKDVLQVGAIVAGLSVWLILTLTGAEDRVAQIRIGSLEKRVDQIRSDQLADQRQQHTTWQMKDDKR